MTEERSNHLWIQTNDAGPRLLGCPCGADITLNSPLFNIGNFVILHRKCHGSTDRADLSPEAQEAVDWVNSDEGQKKLKEAQERSNETIKDLEEARKIDPAKMLEPYGARDTSDRDIKPHNFIPMGHASSHCAECRLYVDDPIHCESNDRERGE